VLDLLYAGVVIVVFAILLLAVRGLDRLWAPPRTWSADSSPWACWSTSWSRCCARRSS